MLTVPRERDHRLHEPSAFGRVGNQSSERQVAFPFDQHLADMHDLRVTEFELGLLGEWCAGGPTFQLFQQHFRSFIVDTAAGHVDGFDLGGAGLADRLIIAVADREIFADRSAKAAEAQHQRFEMHALLVGNLHRQPPVVHR